MPAKKRQHYIPIFYLKLFSIEQKEKQINIYNIPKNKFIFVASLKDQAYKNYFYGKDGNIENKFCMTEEINSKIIKEIVIKEKIPKYFSEEHQNILFFIMTLKERTLNSSIEQIELINKCGKIIASKNNFLKDHLDEIDIQIKNPIFLPLKNVATSWILTADLKIKLLINQTDLSFITSDNPVVFYNQFLEKNKTCCSNTGLTSKGLQIFFPISSKYIIHFYDSAVYQVGQKIKDIVELKDKKDIIKLNGLQFLNANMNLYFDNNILDYNIKKIIKYFKQYLKSSKVNVYEYFDVKDNNMSNSLIRLYREDIKCKFFLSSIHILKDVKKHKLDNKEVHLRNKMLYIIYEKLLEQFFQKRITIRTLFNVFLQEVQKLK